MKHTIHIPIHPKPKQRPRMSKKSRRAYTPQATKDYEDAVASYWDGDKFTTPVSVDVTFSKTGMDVTVQDATEGSLSLRADIDNYIKALLDGLQKGGAFDNDRLVVEIKAVKK